LQNTQRKKRVYGVSPLDFSVSLVRDRHVNTSLRTFITDRRVQLLLEIEALRSELADLDKAEAALGASTAPSSDVTPKTFKGMAIDILRRHSAAGLTASQILSAIQQRFDLKIERSSLSPQLSRLKREGILVQEGKYWRRVGALNKEAAYLGPSKENEPSGESPDGSEARSKDGSHPSNELTNKSGTDVFD
jgi:hypothetical protein